MSAKVKPARKAPAKRAAPRKAAAKAAGRGGAKGAGAVVERAKRAGAVGPHGSDAARSLRDSAILAMLAAGSSQKEVAIEMGVAVRTVQAVVAVQRSAPSVLDELPMDVLEDALRSMRRMYADYRVLAWRSVETNPPVAVAALRGAQSQLDRLLELLVSMGKLPENLELFRGESELRGLADRMLETMELLEAGDITAAEAADVFRSITEPASRPRLKAVN